MMKNWKAYILEVFIIIFSVLIALWFDQLREDYNNKLIQKQTLTLLIQEIEENYARINADLATLTKFNEHARSYLASEQEEDIAIDFILAPPDYSYWETAKASGMINSFDPVVTKSAITIYSLYQTSYGFSYEDYIATYFEKGIDQYPSVTPSVTEIVNATVRMESIYQAKRNLLKSDTHYNYEQNLQRLKAHLATYP